MGTLLQLSRSAGARRTFRATLLIGAAVMAAVDEIVFHQILGWHHFYDHSTTQVALLTDGLLHAAELVALVAGFFLFADARRTGGFSPQLGWAGFFLGAGAFQLFDGIVDHKLLRLHQIRYGVDLLPYDIAWNLAALALLVIGAVMWRRARTMAPGEAG